ncbi:unnamed protein product [Mytilus coruscus]|uniref:Integrase p58-like C-terminal domain-containing protein n=1 Tax=Mytilus coruscus TaxID=42192 RepID=A0A6J8DC14_MYTCO|nr:unnamed protein product [Mytilus coruscus]
MLMFGREIELPVDLLYGQPPQISDNITHQYLAQLIPNLWRIHNIAREKMAAASNWQKQQYDHKIYARQYKVGDAVWVYNPSKAKGKSPKLQCKWTGPYLIIAVFTDLIYKIQKSEFSKEIIIHHDRMKPFIGSFDNWLLKNNKSSVSIFDTTDESLCIEEPEKENADNVKMPRRIRDFQFTPIASPIPIYLGIPDDITSENAHTVQPNLFPEMPRQTGSPVSLLSLLNNHNNNNSIISQLPDPITPLESSPVVPIYTAAPIDKLYDSRTALSCLTPKTCTEAIVSDELPLIINPSTKIATPASPKVEPYDPENPEMDRREVIFKEEIPFYPPRKIDVNSRYGKTYDWSHLQLPSQECRDDPRLQLCCPPSNYLKNEDANWVNKIRKRAREFSTEIKVIPDGYLGVRKEEKVILPDGTIYMLSSTWIPDPEVVKRRNVGVQTDEDKTTDTGEFELIELDVEVKETQTDIQTENTGIQCDILKELFNCF